MIPTPNRVQINGSWYNVREGWAGKLELHKFMKAPEFFAKGTMTEGVYVVFDDSGHIVGEFDLRYMDRKGVVNAVE